MSYVFVLSSDGDPLDPCHPAWARQLLTQGKAAVWRRYPFTIRLSGRDAAASVTHPHRLKLDPGSKATGIAVVAEATGCVVWAGELTHRGQAIRDAIITRRVVRRSRRQRKTRPLLITATGHGTRQRCRTDKHGVPSRHKPRAKTFLGWRTGDLVRARIPSGKFAGVHAGRIAIRFRPSFRLRATFDVHPKYLTRLHRADGYDYPKALN